MTELEAAVDRLHGVPLEDFVAERKRLAKELRGAGDRAAAAELAKLPKPTPPAWALNNLAREDPGAVSAWLDAAADLRAATEHAGKSSAGAVRAAIAAHRDATRALLATVRDKARPNGRELSEPMLDRVRDLLGAATADAGLSELLRAGRIVEGGGEDSHDEAEGELLWAAAPAGPAAKPAATRRRDAAKEGDDGAAERRAAKEREAREAEARARLERLVATAEERLGELRKAAARHADAAAEAEERLEQARRTLHRSESEAAAARAAAAEAAEAAEQAERELRTLTAKLSS